MIKSCHIALLVSLSLPCLLSLPPLLTNPPSPHPPLQGTLTHMAPEVLLQGHMSKAADVYAFGICLWELTGSGKAFAGEKHAGFASCMHAWVRSMQVLLACLHACMHE
jgi:serine/threonine protein kinase